MFGITPRAALLPYEERTWLVNPKKPKINFFTFYWKRLFSYDSIFLSFVAIMGRRSVY